MIHKKRGAFGKVSSFMWRIIKNMTIKESKDLQRIIKNIQERLNSLYRSKSNAGAIRRTIKMYTQPISEDDPMYYEKESNRLIQEQFILAGNLIDAFAEALPGALEKSQKIFEFSVWERLIGEEKASESFPEHAKLWQEHNNALEHGAKLAGKG